MPLRNLSSYRAANSSLATMWWSRLKMLRWTMRTSRLWEARHSPISQSAARAMTHTTHKDRSASQIWISASSWIWTRLLSPVKWMKSKRSSRKKMSSSNKIQSSGIFLMTRKNSNEEMRLSIDARRSQCSKNSKHSGRIEGTHRGRWATWTCICGTGSMTSKTSSSRRRCS